MAITYTLDKGAVDYLNWLGGSISECDMPNTLRVRVAAGCLAIAQDHHHAIVALLDRSLFASSFSLLRCQFGAYVRGEWLALCATDSEVKKFADGVEPPKIGLMLKALEATPAFAEKILTRVKVENWNAMCSFTHTGGLHVGMWQGIRIIEPNYSIDEIRNVLSYAEIFGALAVVGVASLANNERIAESVLARLKDHAARTASVARIAK